MVILVNGTYVYAFSTNFQCGSSCNVNLVNELTKFGNAGNWYICICIQHQFSMWIQLWCQFGDWTNQIWQFRELVHTYAYAFSTDFQCGSSCDVNSVIGLTKFGNLGNWYTYICIQHQFSMWIQLWCQFSDWTNQIW